MRLAGAGRGRLGWVFGYAAPAVSGSEFCSIAVVTSAVNPLMVKNVALRTHVHVDANRAYGSPGRVLRGYRINHSAGESYRQNNGLGSDSSEGS